LAGLQWSEWTSTPRIVLRVRALRFQPKFDGKRCVLVRTNPVFWHFPIYYCAYQVWRFGDLPRRVCGFVMKAMKTE